MKTFQLTLTEEEAHAVGLALMRAKKQMEDAGKNPKDDHARKMAATLRMCVLKLDTCSEVVS